MQHFQHLIALTNTLRKVNPNIIVFLCVLSTPRVC